MIIKSSTKSQIDKAISDHWGDNIEVEVGITTIINRAQFRRSLEVLLGISESHIDHEECLDISHQNTRWTIVGKSNIADFCKTENTKLVSSIIKKEKLARIELPEYGCRIRISKETEATTEYPSLADKHFRFKKRFSAIFKNFRVDYTIIKFGNGKIFDQVKFGPETYEVEVEYIGIPKAPRIEDILDYTEDVLKSLRDEQFLSRNSERQSVLTEYFDVVKHSLNIKGNIQDLMQRQKHKLFIGPKPVTLEMKNVNSIFEGYMVTDKADGQRFLCFVNSKGHIFLIDSKMDVKNTDLVLKKDAVDKWKLSIFDCEVTKVLDSYWILLFDCYFVGSGNQIYKNEDLNERLVFVKDFASLFKSSSASSKSVIYQIKAKSFYGDKIGAKAKNILTKKARDLGYKIDGLIYTPIIGEVPLGKTWDRVFKWKPPQDNTIDFLVLYQRHHNGQDIISNDEKKSLLLYVGGSAVSAKQYFEKTIKAYIAKLFTPSINTGDFTWSTHLPFDEHSGLIKCENGEDVVHNTVVEMRFDKHWIPLRVRHDKTEEAQNGSITANAMVTAESVWKTITYPIEESVIFGEKKVDTIPDTDDEKYYARDSDRNQSSTISMMGFHNFWVKNKCLISKVGIINKQANKKSLIDFACGKGGDLYKWLPFYDTVVGIDIFEDNINNVKNGIYQRMMELPKEKLKAHSYPLKYAFVPLDSSEVINETQINKIKDSYLKDLARCMWGHNNNPATSIKHLKNIANNQFDVASVQFALHYFFENETKLDNFIRNVNNHLKVGGFFIGTCFDGASVANLLQDIKQDESKSGVKNGKTIWSIKKKYNKYDPSKVGQEIEVYIESINKAHVEYLVTYEVLIARLAKYNIYPAELRDGFTESHGGFSVLFDRMINDNQDIINKRDDPMYAKHQVLEAIKMNDKGSEDEKKFSFLNMWFVFTKRGEQGKSQSHKKKPTKKI